MGLGPALFRHQAIEFQRDQREFGELALLQPVSSKLLCWLLVGLVAVAIGFLSSAQFARKQTVPGFLVPAAGTLKVLAERQGVVAALYVTEGQHVKRGDALFAVATPEIASDGEDVNAAKVASLRRDRAMLLGQIAAEQRNAAAQRDRLNALAGDTRQSIGELQAQRDIQGQRVQLAENLVAAAGQLLAKGYMSVVEANRRQDLLMEHRQTIAALGQQLADRQGKLVDAEYALRELPTETARKIQPLHDRISDIDRAIADTKVHGAYVVRSPVDGRVAMLQTGKGQTVQPQQVPLEMVPDGSPLQAELLIPTRAAGFIKPGQTVRFLYDPFPYQSYGSYGGRILMVSRTVLSGQELAGPVQPKEPVYRAIAALDRPDVTAAGKKLPLQAGMLLKAEVLLDRRSLARWILDPLLHNRM